MGWLGTLAAFAISVYYMVLIGWIVGYLGMALAGRFETLTPELARSTYEAFTASPVPVIGLTGSPHSLSFLSRALGVGFLVITFLLAIVPWQQSVPGTGRVSAYTPVPGGVGPMTINTLIQQTVESGEKALS